MKVDQRIFFYIGCLLGLPGNINFCSYENSDLEARADNRRHSRFLSAVIDEELLSKAAKKFPYIHLAHKFYGKSNCIPGELSRE